jgi:NAD(P)-dependent dehydrogenase (short-subunit alcohol dehydrogenase family)
VLAAGENRAARAHDRFGRIDAWVSNAGVYLVGRLEETPPDAFRRVIDVNFLGAVSSAYAALAVFRRQGRGVLVFTASLDGHVAAPHVSAYVASKWAVRGFAESLRQELRGYPDIHVASVSPASIDTPLFQHAANFSGRRIKALTPTYEPAKVARAIVRLIERPRREVIVGGAGKLLSLQRRLSPALADRMVALQMGRDQFGDGPAAETPGNLWEPVPQGTGSTGGWQTVPRSVRRAAMAGAAGAAAAGAALVLRHR